MEPEQLLHQTETLSQGSTSEINQKSSQICCYRQPYSCKEHEEPKGRNSNQLLQWEPREFCLSASQHFLQLWHNSRLVFPSLSFFSSFFSLFSIQSQQFKSSNFTSSQVWEAEVGDGWEEKRQLTGPSPAPVTAPRQGLNGRDRGSETFLPHVTGEVTTGLWL